MGVDLVDSVVLEEERVKGSNISGRINLTLKDVIEGVDKKIKVKKLA